MGRSSASWILTLVALVLLSGAIIRMFGRLGEIGWFLGWTVICLAAYVRWGDKAAILCLGILGMLGAHVAGYKIYGSPRIVETRVFQSSRIVTHLEPPNLLRFADGTKATLYGVTILQPIDLTYDEMSSSTKPNPNESAALIELRMNTDWRHETPMPLHVEEAHRLSDGSCEFRVSVRNAYLCGNTFFPCFWPEDLPSHRLEDLASILICSQAARATNVKAPRDYTSYLDKLQEYDKQVFK